MILLLVGQHDKTLKAIFAEPIRANAKWKDIEALLKDLGAEITEGAGSRVRIALGEAKAVFHRPHPKPDTNKGHLTSVRKFLTESGVQT